MSSLRKLILIFIVVGVALVGYRIYNEKKIYEQIIRKRNDLVERLAADVQEDIDIDSLIKKIKSTDCGESYPISMQTTKVTYHFHENSAIFTHTTTEIFEKYLVREYFHRSNECFMKDTCRYDEKEFNQLKKSLSEIRFKVAEKDETLEKLLNSGGPGFNFSFEVDSGRYLYYNHSDILLGDYQRVEDIINQFIIAHPSLDEMAAREEWESKFEKLYNNSHLQ